MAYRSSAHGEEDYDAFRVLKAAEAGELPDEVQENLEDLSRAVIQALGEDPGGVIGIRFGRRIIVAPTGNPSDAVDVADVDLARNVLLTVGGRDPGPDGALLAQVLFARTEAAVGYARGDNLPGPTMGVMERVLVPLQGSRAANVDGLGTVAVGLRPADVTAALGELDPDEADKDASGAQDA